MFFRRFFEVIFQRDLNGCIAYSLLWNFIQKFENEDDLESADCLDFLLKEDERQSKEGQVAILFWYGVGKNTRAPYFLKKFIKSSKLISNTL